MKIKYYLNKVKIDKRTKSYIETRVGRLQKYLNKSKSAVVDIEIEMDKKGLFRVEIQIRALGTRYIGDHISKTIEAASDATCDELANQIKKFKNKKRTIQKRGAISLKKKFSIDQGARF